MSIGIGGGEVDLGVMGALGETIGSESHSAIEWLERVWIVWCISTAGSSSLCSPFIHRLTSMYSDVIPLHDSSDDSLPWSLERNEITFYVPFFKSSTTSFVE